MTTDRQRKKNKEKFEELWKVFDAVIKEIDKAFALRKKELVDGKIKTMEQGFKSRKDFLTKIESDAVTTVSKALGVSVHQVREKWKVLTLPMPIFGELEDGTIPFSKAKLALPLSLSPEDDKSIESAERLAKKMLETDDADEIKAAVEEESKKVWNPSTAVMSMFMDQATKVALVK